MQMHFDCVEMLRRQLPGEASPWHRALQCRWHLAPVKVLPSLSSGPSCTVSLQYALKIDKEKVDKSRGKSVLQQELQVMAGRHSLYRPGQLGSQLEPHEVAIHRLRIELQCASWGACC